MTFSGRRIPELDGLRAIAVLLVLVWHYVGMLVIPEQGPAQHFVWTYFFFGRTGVDLFFVLSGFLIIGILIDHKDSDRYFSTFYVRRIARIMPPYLILVALFSVTAIAFGTQIPIWRYVTFTQNWAMAEAQSYGAQFMGATWSLAVEEQFYVIAPALLFVVPRRALAAVLVAGCLVSIIGRPVYFHLHPGSTLAPYVLTSLRLDSLCAGGLIAIAIRNEAIWCRVIAARSMLSVALVLMAIPIPAYENHFRAAPHAALIYFGHTYLTCFYALAMVNVLAWRGTDRVRFLKHPVLVAVGAISYSLYLFHTPIKMAFFHASHRPIQLAAATDALLLIAALGTTFVFCWLLYRCVEKPTMARSKAFEYARPAEPSESGRLVNSRISR